MTILTALKNKLQDILTDNPAIQRAGLGVQVLLMVGMIVYVGVELSSMGWSSVAANLPENPVFYLLSMLMFVAVPVSELLIYRPHWTSDKVKLRPLWFAFQRKQAMNDVLIGYSGEAFLTLWGQRNLPLPLKQVFSIIKDNTILSALSSSSVALILVVIFYAGDHLSFLDQLNRDTLVTGILFFGILLIAVPLVLAFGRQIMAVSTGECARIIAIHVGRMITLQGLAVLQWSLILPDVSIVVWFTFVVARLILTRIPMMPNKELVLLSFVISVAGHVEAPQAALAAIFLVNTALSQILNGGLLVFSSLLGFQNIIKKD